MPTKTNVIESYLSIPKTNIEKAIITIVGTSPLVTNPFPVKQIEALKQKQNIPKSEQPKKKEYDLRYPYEEFSNALYWITPKPEIKTLEEWQKALKDNPRFGFHVAGIRESAIKTAYRFGKLKSFTNGRLFFYISNAVNDVTYEIPVIEIITDEPPVLHECALKIKNAGADMRYRPMFNNWKMELEISYLSDLINIQTIIHWFELGGFGCGLGEHRSEKGGNWGAYEVQKA